MCIRDSFKHDGALDKLGRGGGDAQQGVDRVGGGGEVAGLGGGAVLGAEQHVHRVHAPDAPGPLRVTPPVWETFWFRGLAVFLMLAFVAGGIGWRINNIRVQNRRLTQQVAAQTAELRLQIQQREEAEAALAQKAAEAAVVAERTRLALSRIHI